MTLDELLIQQFKVKTTVIINPVTSSLTTAVSRVLGNNPNRLAWTVINMSGETVYLGFDRDVSNSKGIILTISGGSVGMVWNEDFQATGFEIFGKATGAANIYVVEVVTTE